METALAKKTEEKPEIYNHEENVTSIKGDLDYIRSKNAEYAIRVGGKLILAHENIPHGKWLETLDEIGMTPRTAQNLMKIARTFGDRPEILENMTRQKALLITSLPEENLIQLKEDELFIASDGTAYTLGDIKDMTGKTFQSELLNLRNQKNAEIRESKDRAENRVCSAQTRCFCMWKLSWGSKDTIPRSRIS